MNAPDPRQLRYFLAVVEAGSLSRAAEALNLSEPALSKSIRLLEQALQVQLLDRHARGMTPTVFGRALAQHARVIRSELRHAVNELKALRGAESGHVMVGTFPSFAVDILPRAVAILIAERPGVRVTVREALADTLIPMLLAGDLDFAVMTMRPYELDPNLEQEILLKKEQGTVVMSAAHALGSRKRLGLAELQDLTWILPPKPDGLRLEFEQLFEAARLPAPRPAIEYNSVLFIRSMLTQSDCVSFLPRQLVRQEIERRVLISAEIEAPRRQGTVGFVHRRRGALSPAACLLMDRIRAICRAAT